METEDRIAKIDNLLLLISKSKELIVSDIVGNRIVRVDNLKLKYDFWNSNKVENELTADYLVKFINNEDLFLIEFYILRGVYSIREVTTEEYLSMTNNINDIELFKNNDTYALLQKSMQEAFNLLIQ